MNQDARVLVVCEAVEVVEEQVELSLEQLCRSCAAESTLVLELVAHGLLEPAGASTELWRFAGTSLTLTRRAQRLIEDLGLNVAGAAVVIELLERIERLERQLRG